MNAVFASHIVGMARIGEEINLDFVVDASFQKVYVVLHHNNIIVHSVNHE